MAEVSSLLSIVAISYFLPSLLFCPAAKDSELSLFGYHGRFLKIDLDRSSSQSLEIDPDVLRSTIGGVGLGTWLISQTDSAELNPYDRLSSLFFIFSPLVGSPVTTSAKFAVVSKSPLTQRINDSLAGSSFAIAGKRTGFDAIQIVGKAERPSLIVIDDSGCRIEACDELWGRSLSETHRTLREKFGPQYKSAAIGPAGENLVRFATISHDGRQAGRGGSGAVLGSKNIKAVLVHGTSRTNWAEPDRLNQLAKSLSQKSFGPATAKYRELGTAANLLTFNRLQCLPTRNFQQSQFESAEQLAPESMALDRTKVRSSCAACTIGCEHLYQVKQKSNGPSKRSNVRLEYESLFALGPMCGIEDPDTVLEATEVCNELGIDTISAGATIAFAMDCASRGWVDETLEFGNSKHLLNSLHQIGNRTGFGEQLAEGSRRLAATIGEDAIKLAPQVKGLEIPGYDPRKLISMALGFAVGTRGADHNKSSAYELDFSTSAPRVLDEAAIDKIIALEDKSALMDSLILCKFLRGIFADFYLESAELLRLVTGWEVQPDELKAGAQRIIELKKAFNVRAGWKPDEDRLPRGFFEKSADSTQAFYSEAELDNAIQRYNLKRNWSENGYPDAN